MPPPNGGVPILGNGHKHHIDGGQEYAVEVSTSDGATHVVAMNFQLPTGPDGTVDLGAAKTFNPEVQAMAAVGQHVTMAQLQEAPPGQKPPVLIPVPGKRVVVLTHVVSFRYLGRITEKTPDRVVVERPDGGGTYIHYPNAADLNISPYGTEF